MVHAENMVI